MTDAFHTTRWSVVIAAGQQESTRALETLCQTYWYPIYAYIRHRTRQEHDAQDLTQAFFEDILARQTLAQADPERGRFRSYLLTVCKRFLANESERRNAQKRGGGCQPLSLDFSSADSRYNTTPSDDVTADVLFEQQWAVALIESVMVELRASYEGRNRLPLFEALKPHLAGGGTSTYADVAQSLKMSETAIKVETHRLKSRYRELIRAEIGHTVASPDDIEAEIRRLFDVLSKKT